MQAFNPTTATSFDFHRSIVFHRFRLDPPRVALSLAPGARIQSQAGFPHFQEVGRFGSTAKRAPGQPAPLCDVEAGTLPTENVIVFRWTHAPVHYTRAGVNYDHLHRAGCRGLLKIRLLQKADLHLVSLGGKRSSNPIRK